MRFYLARYALNAESAFAPIGTEPGMAMGSIDLRPNPTAADGWCVFATNAVLADIAASRRYLGDNGIEASATLKQLLENRLNVTLQANTLRGILREILVEHARTDGTRWRPLRAGRDRRFRIRLGDLADEWALVSGGATITESFNTADSDTLGPDLTWTEVSGDWDIVSNKASLQDGSTTFLRSARAESDLATDDHYAQATITAISNASSCAGPAVRFDSGANTYYGFYRRQNNTNNVILKVVAGTKTELATSTTAIADGSVLRLEVNGSNLEGFDDGVSYLTLTDTSITGNTRCGLTGGSNGAVNRATFDSFEAGDLAVGGGLSIPVAMAGYRRRRVYA